MQAEEKEHNRKPCGYSPSGWKVGQKLVSRDGRKYQVAADGSFRRV